MTKKSDAEMQEVKQPNVNEQNNAPLPDGESGVGGSNEPDSANGSEGLPGTDGSGPAMIAYERIAKVCHQANKAHCENNGDTSQKDWEYADDHQIQSAIKGVLFRINNPGASPEDQHKSWMDEKLSAGWVFGETKDAEKKTHPCLVPYNKLPEADRIKDAIFCGIVDAMKHTAILK